MVSYVQEIIDASPEDFNGLAKTPAASHLFEVDESAEQLNEEAATLFHHLMNKILVIPLQEGQTRHANISLFPYYPSVSARHR